MNSEALPIISANGVAKTYREGPLAVEVLRDINLQIFAGEMVAIVGASGAGKSTLLHLLGGLDSLTSGEVAINNKQISMLSAKAQGEVRNKCLGFIYQFHHILPEFDALENVCMPLLLAGIKPNIAKQRSAAMLERVGLQDRMLHRLGELSGGERQRVAIARALINQPQCVLADEPTGNLDQATAEQIFELMIGLNNELATAFVVVTHNEILAKRMQKIYKLDKRGIGQIQD